MGKFKRIVASTVLKPKMKIRETMNDSPYHINLVIGDHIMDDENFEVYPDGIDYLDKDGVMIYYPKSKMISRNCEYLEE